MAADLQSLSQRYAKAFFLALKEDAVSDFIVYQKELSALTLFSEPTTAGFFKSPLFEIQEKNNVLNHIFQKNNITPHTQRFIKALNRNGHVHFLSDISLRFTDLVLEDRNDIKVKVRTAYPLKAVEKTRLKQVFSKMLNKNISLEEKIDPSLVAGISAHVGGKIYDASIAGYFDRMEKSMIQS